MNGAGNNKRGASPAGDAAAGAPPRRAERASRAAPEAEASGSAAVDEAPEEPEDFRVILLNDDYTPQVFVTRILCDVFGKPYPAAFALMMKIHTEGRGEAGVYPYDIARTLAEMTAETARVNGYPLRCILEAA